LGENYNHYKLHIFLITAKTAVA